MMNKAQQSDEKDDILKHLVSKHQQLTHHLSSVSSPISSVTPITGINDLKNHRSAADIEREKRIVSRVVSIVGLIIILLCAVIVTLTLKMAPKIDELVRRKSGSNLIHFPSSRIMTTLTMTSTMTTTELSSTSNLTNATTTYQSPLYRRSKS
ncbi:unnamed protein product [Didymodactylos carnosus]|uniref:Uncharacterized protein n=1 Tax=Didymodactylos carnosus TaxID=1234261 RepID=A0A814A6Q8_9BILA|nr:unnamed protein product [Didymodactylos carnosus]CAF1212813.1 unnamed protein product [Didymodactylos carnosus]CAF3691593.1 unnamed protein product [Didymodactylos carnosus]CAF4021706.1 unnamed protein product [Didymodactylos carnosus]